MSKPTDNFNESSEVRPRRRSVLDLFQPNIPVVVVGHFSGSSFVSDQLIVDHSAQYVQQHPNRVKAPNGTTR